jgi:hypothetical protein
MNKRGQNEDFRVLDEFACEAIHDPAIPQAAPNKRGENEGVHVLAELTFEGMGTPQQEDANPQQSHQLAQWGGLSNFNFLMGLPVEALEERIGEELVAGSCGMKPADPATKRSAARNWWQSHLAALRGVICDNRPIREHLFSSSEKDRNSVIATLFNVMTATYTGIPVACLIALTCHYGLEKLCGECNQTKPP